MGGGSDHAWRTSYATPPEGGGGGVGGDLCDIDIKTVLQSVNVEILKPLTVGQILNVSVENVDNMERLCATYSEKIVGAIASPRATDIIACIKAGNAYEAVIITLQEQLCTVHVRRI